MHSCLALWGNDYRQSVRELTNNTSKEDFKRICGERSSLRRFAFRRGHPALAGNFPFFSIGSTGSVGKFLKIFLDNNLAWHFAGLVEHHEIDQSVNRHCDQQALENPYL